MRVENTVPKLCMALGISGDVLEVVQDAASLAMSDLATAVVTEFTSLSGIMGRHYALRDGYSEKVIAKPFPFVIFFCLNILGRQYHLGWRVAALFGLKCSCVTLFTTGCRGLV